MPERGYITNPRYANGPAEVVPCQAKKVLKSDHAQHLHANCNCEYAIRFDSSTTAVGYDPDKYMEQYKKAGGDISAMRRAHYARRKDEINAQKRAVYAAKHPHKDVAKHPHSDAGKSESGIIKVQRKLPDIQIGRSVGAKAKNYDIMGLSTGEMFHLAEETRIQNVEVFAGKGSRTPYRKAYKYANLHGGNPEDWQHVKGHGIIVTDDGDRPAEIHWSQCSGHGKHDFFIKNGRIRI